MGFPFFFCCAKPLEKIRFCHVGSSCHTHKWVKGYLPLLAVGSSKIQGPGGLLPPWFARTGHVPMAPGEVGSPRGGATGGDGRRWGGARGRNDAGVPFLQKGAPTVQLGESSFNVRVALSSHPWSSATSSFFPAQGLRGITLSSSSSSTIFFSFSPSLFLHLSFLSFLFFLLLILCVLCSLFSG